MAKVTIGSLINAGLSLPDELRNRLERNSEEQAKALVDRLLSKKSDKDLCGTEEKTEKHNPSDEWNTNKSDWGRNGW